MVLVLAVGVGSSGGGGGGSGGAGAGAGAGCFGGVELSATKLKFLCIFVGTPDKLITKYGSQLDESYYKLNTNQNG